ncbi:uncharacterized protein DC041_0010636 [Schistosoma bovis]|uniref:Uncharacterized protein n=1 Tax=Schistosoma bovis TaxID=6184 RepID=A0A430PXW5_SCHBO|nr:uncharacterized protein DC041_0010636 [Schistosoma bovis]
MILLLHFYLLVSSKIRVSTIIFTRFILFMISPMIKYFDLL